MNRGILWFSVGCLTVLLIGVGVLYWMPNSELPRLSIGAPSQEKPDTKLYRKIQTAYGLKDASRLRVLVEDLAGEYPQSGFLPDSWRMMADVLMGEKNYDAAKPLLDRILKTSGVPAPVMDQTALLYGKWLQETERFDPAGLNLLEDLYVRSEGVAKQEIASTIGYQYLYKNDDAMALQYFQKASGENALVGSARVLIKMGKYPEAIQVYRNYFTQYPKSERFRGVFEAYSKQTLYYAKKLSEAKLPEQALLLLSELAENFPLEEASDTALLAMSEIYQKAKDYSNAENYLNRVLKNRPVSGDETALSRWVVLRYEQDDFTGVLVKYREYESRYPQGQYLKDLQEWKRMAEKQL